MKVIDILGDKGLSDVISFTNIQQFADNFQKEAPKKIKKTIEVNGRKYVYNPEPSARAVSLVEKNNTVKLSHGLNLYSAFRITIYI